MAPKKSNEDNDCCVNYCNSWLIMVFQYLTFTPINWCLIVAFFTGYSSCFDTVVSWKMLPPDANSWTTVRNKNVTAYGVKIPNTIDYSEYKNIPEKK